MIVDQGSYNVGYIFGNQSKWEVRTYNGGVLFMTLANHEALRLLNSPYFSGTAENNKEGEVFYKLKTDMTIQAPNDNVIYLWEGTTIKQKGQL